MSIGVGQGRALDPQAEGGHHLFTVEFLRSRPGAHLLWHETFRFPGTNRDPLTLDLQSGAREAVLLLLLLLQFLQGTLIPCRV